MQVFLTFCFLLVSATLSIGQAVNGVGSASANIIPHRWVDADTGHTVIRLSNEPGSRALYFRQNAFTPDGKDMIYISKLGMHILNLATLKTRILVAGHVESVAVGTRTRRVFFNTGHDIYLYSVDVDTREITRLGTIPVHGVIYSVNADETMIVGTNIEGNARDYAYYDLQATQEAHGKFVATGVLPSREEVKVRAMRLRLAARVEQDMFTFSLQTGQFKTILKGTDWLSQPQFSPTDPTLILYAHEGPYSEVDRTWTIRSDGSQNQLIQPRSSTEESANREFWSKDGKTIWYEWQLPRGKYFTLVGYDVATGTRKLYRLDKLDTSMYYNVAGNGLFFCGSGRRSDAAHQKDATSGQIHASREWIEVLYPILNAPQSGANPLYSKWFHYNNVSNSPDPNNSYAGWFRRERLVNMYKNDYTKLEPNVRISPDNKYVIFTSNMFGSTYIFAVEVQ